MPWCAASKVGAKQLRKKRGDCREQKIVSAAPLLVASHPSSGGGVARTTGGSIIADRVIITAAVAAAATVPSSFTSITALWSTLLRRSSGSVEIPRNPPSESNAAPSPAACSSPLRSFTPYSILNRGSCRRTRSEESARRSRSEASEAPEARLAARAPAWAVSAPSSSGRTRIWRNREPLYGRATACGSHRVGRSQTSPGIQPYDLSVSATGTDFLPCRTRAKQAYTSQGFETGEHDGRGQRATWWRAVEPSGISANGSMIGFLWLIIMQGESVPAALKVPGRVRSALKAVSLREGE